MRGMKRIKSVAMIFSVLVLCSTMAYSQSAEVKPAGKADGQAQKMAEAFDRMKSSMSSGGSEGISGAGDGLFSALGGFGRDGRDGGDNTSAVRAPMSKAPRKATLANYKAADCWEVCVSWGPLHVCYTWETRCR